ncbi:MAG: hypothetical protein AABX73_01685 [Nanoarchaeota archaeon]
MRKIIILLLILFLTAATPALDFSPEEKTDVSILIDSKFPIVKIISPENTIYFTNSQILLSFSIIDESLNAIWFSINDIKNITIDSPVYLELPEGEYKLTLYANDSLKRVNSSDVHFSVLSTGTAADSSASYSSSSSDGTETLRKINITSLDIPEKETSPEKKTIKQEETPEEQKELEKNSNIKLKAILAVIIVVVMYLMFKYLKKPKIPQSH